ncbi:hypothetical protein [Absidia glauca]|uniref:Uncharacterized protein n=1 Tax=Absidia glauca TaxID=4829 RepID=A0A168N082_ABSGL|nr:hypothetical protein [Absidia glauca]
MKIILVSLSIASLCTLQQIQAAPLARRGKDVIYNNHALNVISQTNSGHGNSRTYAEAQVVDDAHILNVVTENNGKKQTVVLDRRNHHGVKDVFGHHFLTDTDILNDNHLLNVDSQTDSKKKRSLVKDLLSDPKILNDNHLLNVGSHTDSKKKRSLVNGLLSDPKILSDNHVLNLDSHTDSKKRSLPDHQSLLDKLLGDEVLGKLVMEGECSASDDVGLNHMLLLLADKEGLDETLLPAVDALLVSLGVDVAGLHLKRDTMADLDSVLDLLRNTLTSTTDDRVIKVVKIVLEVIKSALCKNP